MHFALGTILPVCFGSLRCLRFFRTYVKSMNIFLAKRDGADANGPRRGTLNIYKRDESKFEFETPGCFIYTQRGSIPHLTPDDLQYIRNLSRPLPLNVSLASVADMAECVKASGRSLSEYIGYRDAFVYVSIQDVLFPAKPNSNEKNAMGLWRKKGRIKITCDAFLEMQKNLNPDMFQIMCDMDTDLGTATNQRLAKSFDNSVRWLDTCLEGLKKSTGSTMPVVATVGGGGSAFKRPQFASEIGQRAVDGFVIDGFGSTWMNSWKKWEYADNIFDENVEVIHKSLNLLPSNKPRFFHAPVSPKAVIQLIRMGVDVFDTSYPSVLADRSEALVRISDRTFDVWNMTDKKCVFRLMWSYFVICIMEHFWPSRYFDDLTPLSTLCGCYTCSKYTKAYVHHLVRCREINAGVLLMIHNLNEYLKFFNDLRQSIEDDCFDAWDQ